MTEDLVFSSCGSLVKGTPDGGFVDTDGLLRPSAYGSSGFRGCGVMDLFGFKGSLGSDGSFCPHLLLFVGSVFWSTVVPSRVDLTTYFPPKLAYRAGG